MATFTESEASTPSSSSTSTTDHTTIGLILSKTDTIHSFLNSASSSNIPDILRQSELSLSSQQSLPYQSLRSIWTASDPNTRPSLSLLLRGSSFLFTSPRPRQKSEELKARLRKLEDLADRKAYAELVKDITPKEEPEPFSSYKDQLGFGRWLQFFNSFTFALIQI
ncbi:Serine/threonine-protein phosphatase 4 catalytic subunit, partial [Bienertia sinuspersici]